MSVVHRLWLKAKRKFQSILTRPTSNDDTTTVKVSPIINPGNVKGCSLYASDAFSEEAATTDSRRGGGGDFD